MWALVETLAGLIWSNRAAILAAAIKYAPLVANWVPKLAPYISDIPKIVAAVQVVEPVIAAMQTSGLSVGQAVIKVVATQLAPHKMTPEEERLWWDRAQGTS